MLVTHGWRPVIKILNCLRSKQSLPSYDCNVKYILLAMVGAKPIHVGLGLTIQTFMFESQSCWLLPWPWRNIIAYKTTYFELKLLSVKSLMSKILGYLNVQIFCCCRSLRRCCFCCCSPSSRYSANHSRLHKIKYGVRLSFCSNLVSLSHEPARILTSVT